MVMCRLIPTVYCIGGRITLLLNVNGINDIGKRYTVFASEEAMKV